MPLSSCLFIYLGIYHAYPTPKRSGHCLVQQEHLGVYTTFSAQNADLQYFAALQWNFLSAMRTDCFPSNISNARVEEPQYLRPVLTKSESIPWNESKFEIANLFNSFCREYERRSLLDTHAVFDPDAHASKMLRPSFVVFDVDASALSHQHRLLTLYLGILLTVRS